MPRNQPRNRPLPPDLSWKERVASLKYIPKLLQLVWQTHASYTLWIGILRIVRSGVPVATLWVGKLIIDEVIRLAEMGGGPTAHLWSLVGIEIAIVVSGEILSRISSLLESLLGDLFSNETSVRMMQHSATLDLAHFEDPDFYDKMERARRQTVNRIALLTQLLNIGQGLITLASLATGLLVYNVWLFLLLLLAVLPNFFGETRFAALGYSLLYSWTPQRRRLDYYRFIGAGNETAREVKTFGLADWITQRYKILADQYYEENKKLSIRKAVVSTALSFIGEAGYYIGYAVILTEAVAGAITIGTLTFLSGAFMQARARMGQILSDASRIQESALYLKDLFDFFEVQPSITSGEKRLQVPDPIQSGFVFDNVGFKYPGSDKWALRGASFAIAAGERIALVGENGAGKTTITKLLARLYDPSEGRILLDGNDLREYDLESLRRSVGVIFQDFVRYDFQFDENIGIGDIERLGPYLDSEDAVRQLAELERREETSENIATRQLANPELDEIAPGDDIRTSLEVAARKSLADSLLNRFPEGWRQMLGKRFDGGVNLSGGEWQKIALARAYLRDAQVLILDEPTAALDARAEYEVFVRFSELVKGRIAIIVSHRFSTVRMADRIIVLDGGAIRETGTHAELVALGGLYAELFTMQAEGYR